jgi:hypothetical protein
VTRLRGPLPRQAPTYVGHVVGASLGLVFVVVNSSPVGPVLRGVACALAGAAFAVVLAAFARTVAAERRSQRRGEPVGFGRRYRLIVAVEVVALFGGLAVLARIEPAAALGWVALVVGVHLLPLSRLWSEGRQILSTGVAMTALGVIGLVLAFATQDQSLVAVVSGVGSGAVLLGTALVSASRTWGLLGPP